MLLREEIEQSFGDGPAHRPIEDVLVAGRRGVRRRRTAGAVAGALAAVAVAGAVYAVAPGSGNNGTSQIATERSPSSAPSGPGPGYYVADSDVQVVLTEDGELVLGPGLRLRQQVINPMRVSPPAYSVAVDVELDGEREWMLIETSPGSGSALASPADDESSAEFEAWVAETAQAKPGALPESVSPETEAAGEGQGEERVGTRGRADEARGPRRGVQRVRRRAADPPAPDRVRRLRRLAPAPRTCSRPPW